VSATQAGPPEAALVNVPRHVAIIMDGNGRWARSRGLPRVVGHRAGTENLRRILKAAVEFGVQILTIYAFSTENWARPRAEVMALLALLENVIDNELEELNASGVRIRHIGRLEGLAAGLRKKIAYAQERTQQNERLLLNVAFNYGGRAEIVDAACAIMRAGLSPEQITEELFSSYLTTRGLPDPDLVIRTAGEMRLSNFLIWQAAYAEFYSAQVYWPDFGRDELYRALLEYQQRQRRFGKLTQDNA
jgi:undecaprenyl diphosphate synthase